LIFGYSLFNIVVCAFSNKQIVGSNITKKLLHVFMRENQDQYLALFFFLRGTNI